MTAYISVLPTCDDTDRLDQQRPLVYDDDTTAGCLPAGWDADEYDLIDQAIPVALPDEDYPSHTAAHATGIDPTQ